MGLTELLITSITSFISFAGYPSLVVLMALESMVVPLPSEAVMPFAGFLISQGRFTFVGIVLASTLGSFIGSMLSYWIGQYGGKKFIKRYGTYVFLNEEHLEKTEKFFKHRGKLTVFLGRLIPVVRHFISLTAGMAQMNKTTFLLYTIVGAAIWNAILTFVGLELGKNWEILRKYSEMADVFVILFMMIGIGFLFLKKRNKKY